jgi:hypothetical protein
LNSHSQVTLDALAFAKQCTRIIALLKQPDPSRALILNNIISLGTFIKKLMNDDQRIGASQTCRQAIEQFMAVVKDIRNMPDKDDSAHLHAHQSNSLMQAIQQLASGVKGAVLDIKRSESGDIKPTPTTSNQDIESIMHTHQPSVMSSQAAAAMSNPPNSYSSYSDIVDEEDRRPLGFQHDFYRGSDLSFVDRQPSAA